MIFRKNKKIENSYLQVESRVKLAGSVDEKIKLWTDFITSSRKIIPFTENEKDRHLIRYARRNVEELKQLQSKKVKKKWSLRNFWKSSLEKKLKSLNIKILYENERDFPLKVVDFDFDDVTLSFILSNCNNFSSYDYGGIKFTAFFNDIILHEFVDYLIIPDKKNTRILKKIYIPIDAKRANRFEIRFFLKKT